MRSLLLVVTLVGLGGCASIVDGSSQSLSVKTVADGSDVAGSQCSLTNNKGSWYVTAPGTVTIHRSYDALNVKCDHDGYTSNTVSTDSATKGMAFGNLLFGGLIGAGVDMSTGAAYDYPNVITVPLTPAKVAKSSGAPTS
jgi:hypothetical protein